MSRAIAVQKSLSGDRLRRGRPQPSGAVTTTGCELRTGLICNLDIEITDLQPHRVAGMALALFGGKREHLVALDLQAEQERDLSKGFIETMIVDITGDHIPNRHDRGNGMVHVVKVSQCLPLLPEWESRDVKVHGFARSIEMHISRVKFCVIRNGRNCIE
jgi:hypothetical protein